MSVAACLVIGTIVIIRQTDHLRNKRLGFAKDHVVIVPIFSADRSLRKRHKAVKQTFLDHPAILSVTACAPHPGQGTERRVVYPEGETGRQWQMQILGIDHDFIRAFQMQLLAGTNLSSNRPADGDGVEYVLNETAVRQLGWHEPSLGAAIGKEFKHIGSKKTGRIVGVVEDFHVGSLHAKIEPLFMCVWPEIWYLACRIDADDVEAARTQMAQAWSQFIPDRPMSWYFLDDRLDRMYRAEVQLTETLTTFALLAIFVACLGLFGLSAYAIEVRTREIGIRRILGSSLTGITSLLTREGILLVGLANLIAWPIAYVAMNAWLSNFPYRITLDIGTFAIGGVITLVFSGLTLGYNAVKAGNRDPVETLRYE